MEYNIESIPEYLSEGDITTYDVIMDSDIERVYGAYYNTKIKVLNKVISDLNEIDKLKRK